MLSKFRKNIISPENTHRFHKNRHIISGCIHPTCIFIDSMDECSWISWMFMDKHKRTKDSSQNFEPIGSSSKG